VKTDDSWQQRLAWLQALITYNVPWRTIPAGFWPQLLVLVLLTWPRSTTAQNLTATAPTKWHVTTATALKETFDSNVYLQDETSLARRESLVTSLQLDLAANWQNSPGFCAKLNYQPEAAWFHSESAENHLRHRITANLFGQCNDFIYDSATALVFINGDSVGPTWIGAGGAPATGGTAVRDRRDAAVYRSSLRLTHAFGNWFGRPAATFYWHDFQTEHRSSAGYQNYVDRGEITAGADLGKNLEALAIWSGYRIGRQDQAQLLQFPEEYDSTFHRVLIGLEGCPASWLKLNVTIGPEFRRYDDKVPATFGDRDELNLFFDSSVTLTPTKSDSVTATAKRFEQPGSSGRAAYEDSTYELCWRHQLTSEWTAGISGRAYGTAFLKPAQRDDWIFSQSAFVNWKVTRSINAEISYTHESGETATANASAREYDRHLIAIGFRYNFGGSDR
jgi:hypothetical protein